VAEVPSLATVMEKIMISNYSYNKVFDELTVDMLLHLNIIDEFLITRFIDIRWVHYKDLTHLQTYHC
jgi:hypothetical protein